METFIKILELKEQFEADFMEQILNENKINHGIIKYEDNIFHNILSTKKNWGYISAAEKDKEKIINFHNELIISENSINNDDNPVDDQ